MKRVRSQLDPTGFGEHPQGKGQGTVGSADGEGKFPPPPMSLSYGGEHTPVEGPVAKGWVLTYEDAPFTVLIIESHRDPVRTM